MKTILYFLLLVSMAAAQDDLTESSTQSSSSSRKKNVKLKDDKTTKEKKLLRKAEKDKSPSQDSEVADERPAKTRLREFLLDGYDKNIHPVPDHTDKVKVNLGMALIHLDLDEKKSVLEVDAWLRMSWIDHYLKWNTSQFNGVQQIHFGMDEIWKPDIYLYNNADGGTTSSFGNTHFLVHSSGEIIWVPPVKYRAFCKEWEVLTSTATRSQTKYDCCPEMYPDVTFQFFLQRHSPFYRCVIILPCMVIMLIVVASFLLPPSAGEKIIVNSSCLIVCVLYLLYFSSTLPALSDQIPLIVLFYSNTAALVGIAIVLNIVCITIITPVLLFLNILLVPRLSWYLGTPVLISLTIVLVSRYSSPYLSNYCLVSRYSSPPACVREFFSGFAGRILCLGHYYHQVSHTHQRLFVEMDSVNESAESDQPQSTGVEGRKQNEWLLVAAGIERFFFLVYTLAFAIVSSSYI
ncbi:neuronal acetylcholine receptor subunit alpha-7 [Eurytemora carolleeae]|uniref:neuronal acetylcholine receptor subunit alpha-7 n=1 Tax=Eurytemora carolleeae TaxID=1294199 RepID=UPI000C760A46|nr:neuronal acetylcholine receptor subunit alpha-7 [Eurytemora carolleeae]|eukprot:XP_023320242.1 neuronal acetylcholine receptor subunit alpha-7-like [Eurytemora affinis]